LNEERILTVGNDGFIKVIDIQEKAILKSFKVCDFCLSSSQKLTDPDIFAVIFIIFLVKFNMMLVGIME
jgi:hypothetical protein